jgi:hypothetical protein
MASSIDEKALVVENKVFLLVKGVAMLNLYKVGR